MRAELATMRESCGTDSQQQLQKLCDISREADTLRRRVSDMDILKMRLEEAENRVRSQHFPYSGMNAMFGRTLGS